jgi:hypothetical protein
MPAPSRCACSPCKLLNWVCPAAAATAFCCAVDTVGYSPPMPLPAPRPKLPAAQGRYRRAPKEVQTAAVGRIAITTGKHGTAVHGQQHGGSTREAAATQMAVLCHAHPCRLLAGWHAERVHLHPCTCADPCGGLPVVAAATWDACTPLLRLLSCQQPLHVVHDTTHTKKHHEHT